MRYEWIKDQLKGEYKEAFEKVELFSMVQDIDRNTDADMMMNLLDLLLTAQKEGKPVEKIIGKDIKHFCREYFEGYSWKSRLIEIPKYFYRISWLLVVLSLLDLFIQSGEKNFNCYTAVMDISGFVVGIVCSVFLTYSFNVLFKTFMFRYKQFSLSVYVWVQIGCLLGSCLLFLALLGDRQINVPVFPILVAGCLYLAGFYLVRAVSRFRKYGSIRKHREKYDQSMWEKIEENVGKELPMELVLRYEKKNRKLEKKGKKPVTPQEYMEKLYRDNVLTRRINRSIVIGVMILCVGMGIFECFHSSLTDGLVLALLMLLCQIPTVLIVRFVERALDIREVLLEKCDQQGVTLVEYVEELRREQPVTDTQE